MSHCFHKAIFNNYVNSLTVYDKECKSFLIRQVNRMPDHYRFGVQSICIIFFFLRLKSKNFSLLDKLFSSLVTVKKYES